MQFKNSNYTNEHEDYFQDGNITITFYINDTEGNIDSKSCDIIKDSTAPVITFLSPMPDPSSPFGSEAPSFNIYISEPHLDTIWYSLNGVNSNSIDIYKSETSDEDENGISGIPTLIITSITLIISVIFARIYGRKIELKK